MRDPDRLNDFYSYMEMLHEWYCPDWRFGQLINNFLSWLGNDGFYLEERDYLNKMNKYLASISNKTPLLEFEEED